MGVKATDHVLHCYEHWLINMSTVTKRKYTHVLRTWNADQNGKSVYPFRSKRRKILPDEWESLLRNNNIIRVYMGILKTAFLVVKNSPEYMHHNLLPCWLNYGAFSAILMVSAPLERVLVLPLSFQRYTIMLLLLSFIKLHVSYHCFVGKPARHSISITQ